MKIVHASGLAGAAAATGTVVVIDVIRAFSVSAYALAGGARECRLVAELDDAKRLADRLPGAVIAAEVDGLPVEGIPLSNSPTMVRELQLKDRVLIQRTSAGTQCAVAATGAARLFAASLVVASATARTVQAEQPDLVTLVATGDDRDHSEDRACAEYIEALLEGRSANLDGLLEPLYRTERYSEFIAGRWPGFPASDVDLCLAADRFDFPMPIGRYHLGLRVSAPIS